MRKFNAVGNPSLLAAIGAALALSSTIAQADLFRMQALESGYMVAADDKTGEGKCGEGKCGAEKKDHEGKCGEGKCGAEKKTNEGKCGEGKCGGKQ